MADSEDHPKATILDSPDQLAPLSVTLQNLVIAATLSLFHLSIIPFMASWMLADVMVSHTWA